MSQKFTTENIAVTFALLLSISAILSFLQTNIFTSPITKSTLILAVGLAVFILATTTRSTQTIETAGITFTIISITVSGLFTTLSLTSGGIAVTLTLVILALISLLTAYITRNRHRIQLTTQRKQILLGIILLLVGLTIGADVTMKEPTQSLSLYDTVQPPIEKPNYEEKYVIGQITITNPGILPQDTTNNIQPSYRACITGVNSSLVTRDSREQHELKQEMNNLRINYNTPNKPIFNTYTTEVYIYSPVLTVLSQEYDVYDIPIKQQNSCPNTTETPQITIFKKEPTVIR